MSSSLEAYHVLTHDSDDEDAEGGSISGSDASGREVKEGQDFDSAEIF